MKEDPKFTILSWVIDGFSIIDGGLSKKDEQNIRMTILIGLDKAQDREIKDLMAFVGWSNENGKSSGWIAGQLMHDLNGFARPEPCFSPRTTGYSDIWKGETVNVPGGDK